MHRWALTVNPHDVEGTADTIYRAYAMAQSERRYRMHRLRLSIRRNDIYRWVDSYLEAALAKHLVDFPTLEDYVPPMLPDSAPSSEAAG